MLKTTNAKNPNQNCFLEGESDEYDSEEDLDNFEKINFDMMGVKEPSDALHKSLLDLINKTKPNLQRNLTFKSSLQKAKSLQQDPNLKIASITQDYCAESYHEKQSKLKNL